MLWQSCPEIERVIRTMHRADRNCGDLMNDAVGADGRAKNINVMYMRLACPEELHPGCLKVQAQDQGSSLLESQALPWRTWGPSLLCYGYSWKPAHLV